MLKYLLALWVLVISLLVLLILLLRDFNNQQKEIIEQWNRIEYNISVVSEQLKIDNLIIK